MKSAQEAGWITKTTVAESRIGALLIKSNPVTKFVKVGIVREITTNTITIDSRKDNLYPYTEILLIDDLKKPDKDNYNFLGYIWPTRS